MDVLFTTECNEKNWNEISQFYQRLRKKKLENKNIAVSRLCNNEMFSIQNGPMRLII